MTRFSVGRQGAFYGELVDLSWEWDRRHFVGHLSIPLGRLDAFLKEVGTPPRHEDRAAPGQQVPVVLLACYGQTHGVSEEEIVAAAAIDALIRLAAQGRLRSGGQLNLGDRLQRLDDARARAAGLAVPERRETP